MSLLANSLRLSTQEGVFCGVTLEPYLLVKREHLQVALEDVPTVPEDADGVEGSSDAGARWCLRSRWYRSTIPRGGVVCSVHPDREATLQCTVCLRLKGAPHLSYHCTVECLKSHWHLHKAYHQQFQANANGRSGIWAIAAAWTFVQH